MKREQACLPPPALDDVSTEDHPARLIAAFVEELDRDVWANMEIDGDPSGTPACHTPTLPSVWLYGFMTGETRAGNRKRTANPNHSYKLLTYQTPHWWRILSNIFMMIGLN